MSVWLCTLALKTRALMHVWVPDSVCVRWCRHMPSPFDLFCIIGTPCSYPHPHKHAQTFTSSPTSASKPFPEPLTLKFSASALWTASLSQFPRPSQNRVCKFLIQVRPQSKPVASMPVTHTHTHIYKLTASPLFPPRHPKALLWIIHRVCFVHRSLSPALAHTDTSFT